MLYSSPYKYYHIKNNGIGGHAARIGQIPSLENLGGRNHSVHKYGRLDNIKMGLTGTEF